MPGSRVLDWVTPIKRMGEYVVDSSPKEYNNKEKYSNYIFLYYCIKN